jgi:cobalt-zinc-cadmium efflux system outer membrane protein
MKYLYKILFSVLVVINFSIASDTVLTVGKALEISRQKSPEINQLRQEIEEKNAQWWTSFGIDDPKVIYLKEGINLQDHSGFTERAWIIEQSLDFPLTSFYRLQKVSMEEETLKKQLTAAYLQLKLVIKSHYTILAYALEILRLREEQLEIAKNLRFATITRLEAGESSELDLMKADILYAQSENEVDEARRAFHEARYTLFKTIGLDPEDQQYHISFPDTLAYVDINIDQAEAMATLENQPEYASISKKNLAAGYGVNEAWSRLLPRLDLSYYRQNYGQGFDYYGYQIGFTIPLWFPLNQRSNIQRAKAKERYWEWKKTEVSLELKRKLEITWHSYEVAKTNIERYHHQVRQKSARLRDLTMEGYLIGELDQLTLLEAQRTYLNSEKNYFDILKTYYLRLIELEKYLQKDLVF